MISPALDKRDPSDVLQLRAAVVDLGAVARSLEFAGSNPLDGWEDGRLRRSAAAWARQLRRIAAAMEAALAKLEAAP